MDIYLQRADKKWYSSFGIGWGRREANNLSS
jgi:hypothetical protein